jgi:uncharacterized repeat protein (TIGR03803 family)
MRHGHNLFRCALLGSAVAIAALTPAFGANGRSAEQKRVLAAQGHHPSAAPLNKAGLHSDEGTYTVLHQFAAGADDGDDSGANVTLDAAGDIYGTTDFGGTHGNGVVFKLAPDGSETLLHVFVGSEGSQPDGGVIVTKKGALYGTTGSGGASGNGVLFSISAKGKYKVLHDFSSTDGSFLRGDLLQDKDGSLYGTALFGGADDDGTVYKYTSDGTFTVLHAFNGADGEFVEHGVVSDAQGNLYGVTAFGGTSDDGTVFKLTPEGTLTTLHSFTGGADGGFLYGGLDIDKDGNLYGSTTEGGANDSGTVFKLAQDGTLTTLYSFTGAADGGSPQSDVLLVGKNVYGANNEGGDPSCQCGVVYEVTAKGKAKVLHTFTAATGGGFSAGLVQNNGAFYGTTAAFGTHSAGVVFSVTKK